MEYGSRLRFILLSIAAIVVLILSAWGIATLARNVFDGESTPSSTSEKVDLTEYIRPNTSVKVTVEGPIVADEKFESYEIEVGQDFRRITVYKGYGKSVVAQKSYDNNDQAFDQFMRALAKVGFTNAIATTSSDERGTCATGSRYTYELKDFDESVQRLWGVSCSANNGSFAGSGPSVRALFKAQIPDYKDIASTNTALR